MDEEDLEFNERPQIDPIKSLKEDISHDFRHLNVMINSLEEQIHLLNKSLNDMNKRNYGCLPLITIGLLLFIIFRY